MKPSDIARLRLFNQRLIRTEISSPRKLVSCMGAMQAQDVDMAQWAVGVRLHRPAAAEVDAALDAGEVLRTHLLRPTWHFVAREDVRWMLELSAPQIKAGIRARHRQLGLTPSRVVKAVSVIERSLGRPRLREELVAALLKAGFQKSDNQMAHLLMLAELEGVACSGPRSGNKQTYAHLDERAPATRRLAKDEALAELASRYFRSHGPATLKDFVWWSGLRAADARSGLEAVKADLEPVVVGGQTYWHLPSGGVSKAGDLAVHLLPAYDEFTISYQDRTASIPNKHRGEALSSNGIFWPLIERGGQVIGTWRRDVARNSVKVEAATFARASTQLKRSIADAAGEYGRFLGMPVEVAIAG